jgi:hypothetical protein
MTPSRNAVNDPALIQRLREYSTAYEDFSAVETIDDPVLERLGSDASTHEACGNQSRADIAWEIYADVNAQMQAAARQEAGQ